MKITASSKTVSERRKICEGCSRLFKATWTCKECGCFMKVKTLVPFVSCPLGKWGKEQSLNEGEHKELEKLLEQIKGKSLITSTQRNQIADIYFKLTGINHKGTKCSKCIKQMITDLKQAYDG